MSKQSIAKEKQGYVPKLIPCVCSNCRHFASTIIAAHDGPGGWHIPETETNIHCALGNFAVKKMGSCHEWSGK